MLLSLPSRRALLAATAVAAVVAAPPAGNFSLCAFYVNRTTHTFAFGRFAGATGSVSTSIPVPQVDGAFDGVAAGAEDGLFVSSVGMGAASLVTVNWRTAAVQLLDVAPPAGGFDAPAFVRDLSTDFSGPAAAVVGMLTNSAENAGGAAPRGRRASGAGAGTWWAVAAVNTSTGATAVLRNATADVTFPMVKYGLSAFDSARRVLWTCGWTTADNLTETLLGTPADGAVAAERVAFMGDWWDAIALLWSPALDSLVALATSHHVQSQPMAWVARDASQPTGWRTVFAYPVGAEIHPDMGDAAIEDGGAIAAVFLLDEATRAPVLSYVDLVHGAELSRAPIDADVAAIADIVFC